jgi:hypothetical protein
MRVFGLLIIQYLISAQSDFSTRMHHRYYCEHTIGYRSNCSVELLRKLYIHRVSINLTDLADKEITYLYNNMA